MSSIRYEMYRREILRYLSSMTIKFSPLANLISTKVSNETDFVITNDRENPYYRNLCGLYSFLDTQMEVVSAETGQRVPFNKELWNDYPKTAALYTIGSEAYSRLCLEYPNQVGLIRGIMYPCPDIDQLIAAEELSIVNHVPSYLRENEREIILQSCRDSLKYIRDRWFVMDYCCEDQYPIVFMSQVYLLLFTNIIKQRQINCDTHAVHHMHVWDRLMANGLGQYESLLTETQARWFYRNMRYLKENRGRKSNLILLADNLLRNLKVHLVSKRIFQQTTDLPEDVVMVPEFLSEEIVDYSVTIPEAVITTTNNGTPVIREIDSTLSADILVNKNAKESMDDILHRVFREGYYPEYSVDDSVVMEAQFAKTVTHTIPTRLMEFQKYIINTQYLRHLTVFIFDSLMYQYSNGNLNYRIAFKDENTNLPVNLSVSEALILMHYLVYKKHGITPDFLPESCPVDSAYLKDRPAKADLPKYFWFNKTRYHMDTLVQVTNILNEVAWINERFTDAGDFIRALGIQFDTMVQHIRSAATEPLLIYQWAMWYFYKYILAQEDVPLHVNNKTYTSWFAEHEAAARLIDAYEELPEKGVYYEQLGKVLLRQVLPIEESDLLVQYAGAIYDNTAFYEQIKQLFTDWTSHDLTYLDTDRSDVTYLNLMPTSVMTGHHVDNSDVEITQAGLECISTEKVMLHANLKDEYSTKPTLVNVEQSEIMISDQTITVEVTGEMQLAESSDISFYDNQQCIKIESSETQVCDPKNYVNQYQLFDGVVSLSALSTGIQLVDASQPD